MTAPTGTITFLFSDIEGSTKRRARDRVAMEAAVRLHDELLRATMAAHGGYVFKTMGDAFCVAFGTPEAAAAAALDGQRLLAAADFSAVDGLLVRMALATGTADERDDDYFGPTVNRVARLLPLGHGGQILLASTSAGLVRENPPPLAQLIDLGDHALKDFAEHEHVYQLIAPDLPSEFPELRSQKAMQRWLVPDAMRTQYFTGRDDLLAQVRRQLVERRRAVLSGLGGVGKTQSAIEYAVRHRTEYPAGVFWVDAETAGGLNTGFGEIAKTLRLPAADSNDLEQTVRAVHDWLNRTEGWLLIFDNVDERRDIYSFVPPGGKGHILITSRETVFQELGIPRALEVRDLDGAEAVAFLLSRTGREDCQAPERAAATELAAELGNLPLALEQAAAYVAETGAGFAAYLSAFRKRRVSLLEKAGGLVSRDTVSVTWAGNFAAVRQASLESADALRTSAFLSPDAVPFELFGAGADDDDMTMAELLRPLARYSLIRTDANARTYSVHRLVQAIVRDALGETGAKQYIERAIDALNAAFPDARFSTWDRSARLVSHAMSVASWIETYGVQSAPAAEILNKTGRYLTQRGRYVEAESLLRQALAIGRTLLGPDDPVVGASLHHIAVIYQRQCLYRESERLHLEALAIRERSPGENSTDLAVSLLNIGNLYLNQGRYTEAQAVYERALGLVQLAFGANHEWVATTLNNLARIHETLGRYDEALDHDERALAMRQLVLGEDHPHVALSFGMVANGYARRGNFAQAEAFHERAQAIRERALGVDHDEYAEGLTDFAMAYLKQGRYAEARPMLERALAIYERAFGPDHLASAYPLSGLAQLRAFEGRVDEAFTLFERTLAMRELALGPDHVDVAATLLAVGALHADEGRPVEATAYFARALAIKETKFGEDHSEVEEIRQRLRAMKPRSEESLEGSSIDG